MLAFTLFFGNPAVALAHAELATSDPGDTGILPSSPAEVVLTFTEPLDPTRSSIKLVDGGGSIAAQGSTVDRSNPKTMRLALAALSIGTYTVRWISASALDGDLDHGTTTFTIVRPETPSCTDECGGGVSAGPPADGATSSPVAATPVVPPGSTASSSEVLLPIAIVLVVIVIAGLGIGLGRRRTGR